MKKIETFFKVPGDFAENNSPPPIVCIGLFDTDLAILKSFFLQLPAVLHEATFIIAGNTNILPLENTVLLLSENKITSSAFHALNFKLNLPECREEFRYIDQWPV